MAKLGDIAVESQKFVINPALLEDALEKTNPHAPTALIVAVVQAMIGSGTAVAEAVRLNWLQGAEKPAAGYVSRNQMSAVRANPVPERIVGDGMGALLPSAEAGIDLLRAIAVEVPLEHWAGDLVTPSELCDRLGVSRSAISAWRKANDVIALPKGKRGHVFPLLQFKDGRPLTGMREILDLTSDNALVAWQWLMTRNVDFDFGTPIAALRSGGAASVLAAAHRSFA